MPRCDTAKCNWKAWALCAGLATLSAVAAPVDPVKQLNAEALTLLRSDPQAAQQQAQRALALAQTLHDPVGEAAARVNLGSIERQRGRYDQAVVEFERAAVLTRDARDQAGYASAQANLGITLDLGGLHAEALAAQGEALKIHETLGNFGSASAVLTNIGNTLSALGDNDGARAHYQRALDMKRTHGIRKGVGAILNNLADLALESGTTEQAVHLLDEAIAAHEEDGDRIGQGLAFSNRGIAHARAGRFDAALADIQRGEAIARDLEHAVGRSAALRARAEVWLLRARSLDGEARDYALINAEREARTALVSSNDSDDPDRRLAAKRQLADVLAARGQGEPAIALIDEIDREMTAIRAEQDEARVAVVRARYERQQADAELALLREREAVQAAELARSRLLLRSALGLGIAGVTALVLLFSIGRERRIRAEALREQGEALREALQHAEAQGRRAQAAAQLNQRLLTLAGDDLQGPLIDIRAGAERLLAAHHGNPEWSRPLAVIARHASELMQVVVRMRESAQVAATDETTGVSADLSEVLERGLAESDARAGQRQQRLRGRIAPNLRVRGEIDAIAQLCSELLDHALRQNPADSNIDVVLQRADGQAVLTLSDHDGLLQQRLLDAPQGPTRDTALHRLGFGLLRETVAGLGGRLDSIRATAPETGQVLRMVLPLVA